jgi:hypothetical protein
MGILGWGLRALSVAGLLALAACAGAPVASAGGASASPAGPAPRLAITVDPAGPATLAPGTIVRVRAALQGAGQLEWVSGTVKIMGAPVLGLKPTADGAWAFKTMVPPMTTVPAGRYKVKVWGRLTDGRELSETLDYEVK